MSKPSFARSTWQCRTVISTEDYLFYVDEALDGVIAVVRELGDDLANQRVDGCNTSSPYAFAPIASAPWGTGRSSRGGKTQGAALVHVFEELAQHRGHMEAHRDVLVTDWARTR